MTKRHDALIPLTHDHHHTLAQARRLRDASAGDSKVLRRAADDFVNFYFGRARLAHSSMISAACSSVSSS